MSKALVLFSGGQDSTVCLAWALAQARFETVATIGFAYDQRHDNELKQRPRIRQYLLDRFDEWAGKIDDDHVVNIALFREIVDSALLTGRPTTPRADGLPATFVPGRNLVFLLAAAIVAKERGYDTLVGGMCETDFSGYPDCRNDTIKALQVAMNLGLQAKVNIETPLMWIDKCDTWQMAYKLGGRDLVKMIIDETHTCYENARDHFHPWGYGCGSCAACELRAKGFAKWMRRERVA